MTSSSHSGGLSDQPLGQNDGSFRFCNNLIWIRILGDTFVSSFYSKALCASNFVHLWQTTQSFRGRPLDSIWTWSWRLVQWWACVLHLSRHRFRTALHHAGTAPMGSRWCSRSHLTKRHSDISVKLLIFIHVLQICVSYNRFTCQRLSVKNALL